MKIVDKRKGENIEEFYKLKIGDVFHRLNEKEFYMKTEEIYEVYFDDWGDDYHLKGNAICLRTGELIALFGTNKVIPLKCECIITD